MNIYLKLQVNFHNYFVILCVYLAISKKYRYQAVKQKELVLKGWQVT